MHRRVQRYCRLLLILLGAGRISSAQQPVQPAAPPVQTLTWENVKERFEQNNPTLLADKLNIDESQAEEITAHLRPNPGLALLSDQITPFNVGSSNSPFQYLLPSAQFSYLHDGHQSVDLRLR